MEQSLFHQIFEEFRKISFSSEEMVAIFNKKYENTKTPLQLLDEQGEIVTNKEGIRIEPGDIKDIDDLDKARHIKGHIYKLKDNKVDYVKTLAKEKEILEVAEKKDSKLRKLVEEYMADFKEEVL